LTGIHILLTYQCTLECDHCFLHSSPRAEGTMALPQVRSVLGEAHKIGTVEWIYFEGGEPFLYSLSMIEGVRLARKMGFEVGIVTNAYWAVSDEDAEVWLRPLAELGIGDLSVSDDSFHCGEGAESPAKRAVVAAHSLGIPASSICIQKPFVDAAPGQVQGRGGPVIGGGAMFKGRAVEKLIADLPRRPWRELSTCPYEDLSAPSRVHVDAYGNVHLCQGLSMGNMWERPLSGLVREYQAGSHPVCGPLVEGGPALLAEWYGVDHDDEYVDECHLCYLVRRALAGTFPEFLAPRQVYGLGEPDREGERADGRA
jgi:hypothetical protein